MHCSICFLLRNGQLETGLDSIGFEYNWDSKLRKATIPTDSNYVHIKYDPLGNRVYKWSIADGNAVQRQYIIGRVAQTEF